MDSESELALRARLRRLHIVPPDDIMKALVEVEEHLSSDDVELIMVLEQLGVFQDNDSPDFGESGTFVRAPIGPRPNRNSAAIKPTN